MAVVPVLPTVAPLVPVAVDPAGADEATPLLGVDGELVAAVLGLVVPEAAGRVLLAVAPAVDEGVAGATVEFAPVTGTHGIVSIAPGVADGRAPGGVPAGCWTVAPEAGDVCVAPGVDCAEIAAPDSAVASAAQLVMMANRFFTWSPFISCEDGCTAHAVDAGLV